MTDSSSTADMIAENRLLEDEALMGQQASPSFEPGVMVFNQKRYAVDLFWLVAEDEGQTSLAKKRAKEAKADFFCLRSSVSTQHAFGYLKKGHRMGMAVAGAEAADMLVGEWHAVFRADNGWWYLAVHGDAIAPEGDRFFSEEEDIFAFFKEEMQKYKWPRSYAPVEWGIEGTSPELDLDRMLDQAPSTTLRPATLDAVFAGRRNKILATTGGLVLLAVIFVLSLLPNLILSKLEEPPPLINMAKMNITDIKAPPRTIQIQQTITGQKLKLPSASKVIVACGQAIADILRPLPGWDVTRVECQNNRVAVEWSQRKGTVDLLMQSAGVFPAGATAQLDGNRFISTYDFKAPPPRADDIKLMNRVDAVLLLNQRLGGAGSLTIRYVQPPAPAQDQTFRVKSGQPAPEAPPPYLEAKYRTFSSPKDIASYFNVDGMEIKSVQWNFNSGEWSYDVKMHIQS